MSVEEVEGAPQFHAEMGWALEQAHLATTSADVPIGAVVLDESGQVISTGRNLRERDHDPTGHAELVALRAAGAVRGRWNLSGCTLVVTLEPCAMCAGAAVLARLRRVVFGATDPKAGACGSVLDLSHVNALNHHFEVVSGIRAQECGKLLREFFAARR